MKKLLAFFYLSCVVVVAAGQTSMIRFVKDDNRGGRLVRIEFFDIKTEKVLKTVDVVKFNPFNHYKFPVVPDTSMFRVFDLNGVTAAEIFPDSVFSARNDWDKIKKYGLVRGQSGFGYYGDVYGYAVLFYDFQSYTINGSMMGMTAVYVFDRSGKTVFKQLYPDHGIRQLSLSPSGRLLAWVTGKYGNDNIAYPWGTRIVDLAEPRLMHFEPAFNPGLFFLPDEKLMMANDSTAPDGNHIYQYRIFDIPARKCYKKSYPSEMLTNILNITTDAIVFRDGKRDTYTEAFETVILK